MEAVDTSAKSAPLGLDWVSQHGRGRIPQEHLEALKAAIMRDLASKGIGQDSSQAEIVKDEVEHFIASGRVSDSNLSRLQRRIMARVAGSRVKGEGTPSVVAASEFSHSSRQPAVQSARKSKKEEEKKAKTPPSLALVPEDEDALCRWSEVGKLWQNLELLEKVKKREAAQTDRLQLRESLQKQLEDKKKQKQKEEEEAHNLYLHQQAELERWRLLQEEQQEAHRRKVQEVKKSREEQCVLSQLKRDEEKRQQQEEDLRLVQRCVSELEREQKLINDKRVETMMAQRALAKEWQKGQLNRGDLRAKRIEEERKKVEEYKELLEKQEARNKRNQPKVRATLDSMPQPFKRRGEELYFDETLVNQQLMANKKKADEEERLKQERTKAALQSNQEFLVQQIAERNRQRMMERETAGSLKIAAQAAVAAHAQEEKRRAEERKEMILKYKVSLDQQIMDRQLGPQSDEDKMSLAEKAINRTIITQAQMVRQALNTAR